MKEPLRSTNSRWKKSSYSDGGATCVEFALLATTVGIRDSKVQAGPILVLSPSACVLFLDALTG